MEESGQTYRQCIIEANRYKKAFAGIYRASASVIVLVPARKPLDKIQSRNLPAETQHLYIYMS